jgi:putative tryptophan/tyrosine transport system substrate-binding protein
LNRRKFIALASGAVAWPVTLRAQQRSVPVVGLLRTTTREADQFAPIFRRDMRRLGWEEGRQIAFEYRWADGRSENLPIQAKDLAARAVTVIVAFGNVGVAAAQSASETIPIVGMTDDMVAMGLAASMAHPGGNTTGVSIFATELDAKRFEILREFLPQARRLAVLADPTSAHLHRAERLGQIERIAHDHGIELVVVEITNETEVARALDAIQAAQVEGVNVLASPILNGGRSSSSECARRASPRSTNGQRQPRKVGSLATGPALAFAIATSLCSSTRSSEAPSRRTCRSSNPRSLPSRSTPRPPRRWGSPSRRHFYSAPTR